MAANVNCPGCGKPVKVRKAEGGGVGYVANCRGCGSTFMVTPAMIAAAEAQAAAPETYEEQVDHVRRSQSRRTLGFIALGLGVVAVLGGLVVGLDRMSTAREAERLQAGRDRITALRTQADALVKANRLEEARTRYYELEDAAAAMSAGDPEVKKLAGDVAADQKNLSELIARREEQRAAAKKGPQPGFAMAGAPAGRASPPTPAPHPRPPSSPGANAVTPRAAQPRPSAPATTPAVTRSDLTPVKPVRRPRQAVTDADIEASIRDGVDYLLSRFDLNTTYTLKDRSLTQIDPAYYCGMNALAVYALMQSAAAVRDDRLALGGPLMGELIEGMKGLPADRQKATYARSIRAAALAVFMRDEDRSALKQDLDYLLTTHNRGAYAYEGYRNERGVLGPPPDGVWDNSNSQYGLLGVWAAAESGYPVPADYWKDVVRHWGLSQKPNGQWSYSEHHPAPTLSMTTAGTASLFVAYDYLDTSRLGLEVGVDPDSPALRRALGWWEKGEGVLDVESGGDHWAYVLYGIERVGLASGFKYFGKHDWYRELAKETLARQQEDGSWGDEVDTSFALLFLSRGRHPVLVNKLRFPGQWANRPRDAANLMQYASKRLERPLNWQVVDLRHPWHEWLDAPVLYLASHTPPPLLDNQFDKIRDYVEAGGLLYTQSDGESAVFDQHVSNLAKRLFPKYEYADVPADHPIFNVVFKVKDRPPLKGVSNGARLLMVHSPRDLAVRWHNREERSQADAFAVGINLMVYAAGKRDFRNRLDSPYLEPPDNAPVDTVGVARVRYDGNWDPEPGAWRRFRTYFLIETGTGAAVEAVELKDLGGVRRDVTKLAHLTGTAKFEPTKDELAAMRKFVESGGVLLVDATGGGPAFADSARAAIAAAFPNRKLAPVTKDHPLLNADAPGMDDLTKMKLRPFVYETRGAGAGTNAFQSFRAGDGHVVYTPLDVTSGLLGTRTWSVAGYDPGDAAALVKNVLLWTMNGQSDRAK